MQKLKIMKIPAKSPPIMQLLKQFSSNGESFAEFLSVPYSDDRYFSYEDLKYRPLPVFAKNIDEWWLKIQLHRLGKFRDLPLLDSENFPFRYFIGDEDWAILHDLDLRAGGFIGVSEPFPGSRENTQFLVSSLMEESIASSLLEGAPTTREKAKEMLRQQRIPRDEGERMVLNNYKTMQKLREWKNEELSIKLLFRIHAEISAGVVKPGAEGRFRRAEEIVSVGDDFGNDYYIPPRADLLPARIQKLCDFANDRQETPFLHPVVKAVILHFWLAYEHPFCDGNGRTARALFYWYLIKNGYWICEYISISPSIKKSGLWYYRAFLNSEFNGNDLNYFIKYHLEILQRSVSDFLGYVRRKQTEQAAFRKSYSGLNALNSRQNKLLVSWLKRPYSSRMTSVSVYQRENEVSRETARLDLEEMVRLRLVLRKREGRAFVFVPADDFEENLK